MPRRLSLVLSLLGAGILLGSAAAKDSTPPIAEPNANNAPAGKLEGGVLNVTLELRMARWYPDDDGGTGLLIPVFAEAGRPPQVPGPLLRMKAGTDVKITLHNQLNVKATVFGLYTRPADRAIPIELEPGATREVRFSAGAAGTYHYFAIADAEVKKLADRWYHDGALSGAFIVDDPSTAAAGDRVFVLNIVSLRETPIMEEHEILTVNGKAWPYTERLTAREGEPLHWRVVNSTPSEHPMHLHGAYFTVLGAGDAERYTQYSEAERRTVVTEYIKPGSTFEMKWTPRAPGGWLFHCHYMLHMAPELAVPRVVKSPGHDHSGDNLQKSATKLNTHGMGGLVLAVNVQPRLEPRPVSARGRARQLELIIEAGENAKGTIVSTVREVSSGETSSSSPGPLLLLRRGEPVDIKVINRLKEPTSIHWHGLELESYYDGVPGIGSRSGQVTPTIPPGGAFVARMTPPRSGTFIYHTHWAHETQLTAGLYGALLVLEPGVAFDADRQKVLVVGAGEVRWITSEVLLNGARKPPPLELRRGETYRLRLINISPNLDITVNLGGPDEDLEWRAVAKDGFELPPSQRRASKARLVFSVGETYDFEFAPEKMGEYQLRFRTNFSKDPAAEAVADVLVR